MKTIHRVLLCLLAALMPLIFIWINYTFIPDSWGYEIAASFSCICVMAVCIAAAFYDSKL